MSLQEHAGPVKNLEQTQIQNWLRNLNKIEAISEKSNPRWESHQHWAPNSPHSWKNRRNIPAEIEDDSEGRMLDMQTWKAKSGP